ncbi:MAG: DUF4350 domain-containing protein [Caldilineaceae bacterium]|nr:DUF4350 domain-containing protein [Caldilineaceae bacterium]
MVQGSTTAGRVQLWLGLALLAVLVAFTLLQGEPSAARPFDPTSAAPTGLRALWLWLEAMDYQVERNDGPSFVIPDESAVLFVFPNQATYTTVDVERLEAWVRAGGTLVLIGLTSAEEALTTLFPLGHQAVTTLLADVEQRQPLLPDLNTPIRVSNEYQALDLAAIDTAIPVLTTPDGAVTLALQPLDKGLVWHTSLHHSLINAQLRDPAQATLVPAFLRQVPAGGRVVIDTYHLFGPTGETAKPIRSLQDWLYRTTLGWAVLFSLGVTLLFIMLQGRRLGPPLILPENNRRREAAEYVIAMANLMRRGQQRAFVAEHHQRRFKRTLGRVLALSPAVDDAAFIRQVGQADPTLSAEKIQQLATLLNRLTSQISDQELTQTVSQLDDFLARYQRKTVG